PHEELLRLHPVAQATQRSDRRGLPTLGGCHHGRHLLRPGTPGYVRRGHAHDSRLTGPVGCSAHVTDSRTKSRVAGDSETGFRFCSPRSFRITSCDFSLWLQKPFNYSNTTRGGTAEPM